jgi:hypothetical protein
VQQVPPSARRSSRRTSGAKASLAEALRRVSSICHAAQQEEQQVQEWSAADLKRMTDELESAKEEALGDEWRAKFQGDVEVGGACVLQIYLFVTCPLASLLFPGPVYHQDDFTHARDLKQ